MRSFKLLVRALAAALISNTASAATLSFGPLTNSGDPAGSITTNLAIDPNATTITSLELIYQGDFGQVDETLEVFIEGTSIGVLGPDLVSTGAFATPSFLDPTDVNANLDPLTSTALLNLDVSGDVSDGFLELSFVPGPTVNLLNTLFGQGPFSGLGNFSFGVVGTVDFETAVPVPLPGAAPLLLGGLGLLGYLGWRRRRTA